MFSHLSNFSIPILVTSLLAAGLTGCKPKPAPAPPAPGPAAVTAVKPISLEVTDYQLYTGYLEAVETVTIRARVRGFLRRVAFQEGSDVKVGDLLYEIDPREYQAALDKAQADEAKSESELRRAQSEEDRALRLRRSNAMSEEEYTQRVVATELARAALRQAQAAVTMAQLDLSFTTIKAPIAGRISRTLVTEGNLVGYNEATALTNIVRLDELFAYFDVPEKYALKFDELAKKLQSPGTEQRRIPVDIGVANEEGYPHPGHIDFRENRVDPGTGTIRLRARVKNTKGQLYPGLYAHVRVPESAPQQRFMIPEAALMSDQRGRFLYVVKADGTVEARTVTVGSRRDTLVAVVTGITGEDTVIINGLQRVRPGAKVVAQLETLKTPPAEGAAAARAAVPGGGPASPQPVGTGGNGPAKGASNAKPGSVPAGK